METGGRSLSYILRQKVVKKGGGGREVIALKSFLTNPGGRWLVELR